ncbi:AAA-domain-containing protein [Sistotremastrum suecicum HHB10207 ss-3]|uniref:Peroxisomal ATPase PEX6 n=1 Tax=Sistotremastrum suecicum HHB10207 ss-3 TaxID=1314776 RepID=A0A166C2H7_9AGAM|nr:AAA-domain-containing protein [Sistotremastrum suecicum HHB10207 ss-3]
MSASLFSNLFPSARNLENLQIWLHPNPFPDGMLPLPTARSITVARVASSITMDRGLQNIISNTLRKHFEQDDTILKKDDIISVLLDRDESRLCFDHSLEESFRFPSHSSTYVYRLPYPSVQPGAAVHFKITNIDHDISEVRHGNLSDLRVVASLGELGCRFDRQTSRMMLTGVEYASSPLTASQHLLVASTHLEPDSETNWMRVTRTLRDLLSACLETTTLGYGLHSSIVIRGHRGVGKFKLITDVTRELGVHLFEINCYDLIGDTDVKTAAMLQVRFEKASSCSPSILLLRNVEAFSRSQSSTHSGHDSILLHALQECIEQLHNSRSLSGSPTPVVATCSTSDEGTNQLLSCFKHELNLEAPHEESRESILSSRVKDLKLGPDVFLAHLAKQTAAMVAADLCVLAREAQLIAIDRILNNNIPGHDIKTAGISVNGDDFEAALAKVRTSYSESIGAPKIPSVTWEDVGGLAQVKSEILDTIQLPLEHPELFLGDMKKRSGVLLYGPPGTGKTLLAKAVATTCSLNFLSVKGPELLNMYIGESEANVRRVFQKARDAQPCVIFFDELDSVAPARGNHGDSGGVMDRIVSQLLSELDGVAGDESPSVFVIGATNRPDLLDPALLRPGRFDRMLYIGLSQTHDDQERILAALTRKFHLDPNIDLHKVAESCPFNYTGADFYAICSNAMMKAMARKAQEVDKRVDELNTNHPGPSHPPLITPQYYLSEMADPSESHVSVSQGDFEQALREVVPSVSQQELQHYKRVQEQFADMTLNGKKTDD